MHCAARYGHSDIADTICVLHKILDEVDHLSWINLPDMYAAPALLFSHCSPARVVIAPASYGSTPLILAARCGHLATVTALLRHGATASDGLLATISHYAQLPISAVSRHSEDTSRMDLLRLRENLDDVSRAVRRALLKQRYDADYDNIGC